MKEAVWPWFAVIPAVMGSQESGPIHVFTSSPWQLPGEPAVGSLLGSDCVPVKRLIMNRPHSHPATIPVPHRDRHGVGKSVNKLL